MALKLDMQGKTYGPFVRTYTFRELSLFALGCGAGYDGKTDLEYVYEKDMKILPMFAAMPIVDSEVTKTIDYGFNWGGSLHWGFDLNFHQPMTKLSGTLSTKVLLKGLYDRGEGRGLPTTAATASTAGCWWRLAWSLPLDLLATGLCHTMRCAGCSFCPQRIHIQRKG